MKSSSKIECAAVERRIETYSALQQRADALWCDLADATVKQQDLDLKLTAALVHLSEAAELLEDYVHELHWSITAHEMGV